MSNDLGSGNYCVRLLNETFETQAVKVTVKPDNNCKLQKGRLGNHLKSLKKNVLILASRQRSRHVELLFIR